MEIGTQFKTVALVGRNNTPGIREPLTVLAACILKRGFDVVFGVRRSRAGETIFKKLSAALFYRVLRVMLGGMAVLERVYATRPEPAKR